MIVNRHTPYSIARPFSMQMFFLYKRLSCLVLCLTSIFVHGFTISRPSFIPHYCSSSTSRIPLFETTFPEYSTQDPLPSLPWGPKQEWALRENISKYSVFLLHPPPFHPQLNKDQTLEVVLWRSMLRDVTELSGYDISMLQNQYQTWVSTSHRSSKVRSDILLPYLDRYEFQTHGGVSGIVYGMSGILDGTRIETSSLIQPEYTIPRGYVQTHHEYMAYELGVPVGDRIDKPLWVDWTVTALERGIRGSKGVQETSSTLASWAQPLTITFLALTGTTALVNLLSHHLTVNVFWV